MSVRPSGYIRTAAGRSNARRLRGRPPPRLDVDVEPGEPFLLRAVVVRAQPEACLHAGIEKRPLDAVNLLQPLHPDWSVATSELVVAGSIALESLEVGENLGVGPPDCALLGPAAHNAHGLRTYTMPFTDEEPPMTLPRG